MSRIRRGKSRKRKSKEIYRQNDPSDLHCKIPSAKRQKLESITASGARISSSLFSNMEDFNQFKSIYETINKSLLIKQLQIPEIILKSIAEYATGNILKCDNFNQCHNEIFVLNQHKQETRDYFYTQLNDTDNLNKKDIQKFCNQCSNKLEQCDIHYDNCPEECGGDYSYYFDSFEYCNKRFMKHEKCQCGSTFDKCKNHRAFCDICQCNICWSGCARFHEHWKTKCKGCEKDICANGLGVSHCRNCYGYVCENCTGTICDCEYDSMWWCNVCSSCFVHKGCNVDHSKYLVICNCKHDCNYKMCEYCNCREIYPQWLSCLKCGKDGDTKVYNIRHIETDSVLFYCHKCDNSCGHMICNECDHEIDEFDEEVGCQYCGTVCDHEIDDFDEDI
eukprot:446841_1